MKPPVSLLPDLGQIPSDPVPLPESLIDTYILPFEAEEFDEFTEYIPYARISGTKGFEALVYWKAGVLRYEFILATYSPQGAPVSHAIIGGMRFEDEGTIHSVAIIHENLSIVIAEGMTDGDDTTQVSSPTQTYHMSILDSGEITYQVNEKESKE